MENWLEKSIQQLKEKYETCQKKQERALASYIFYILRLLNGMAQMQFTDYLVYEKRMIWPSMKIFVNYFFEEVDRVINGNFEENIKEKRYIIDEIEEAVIYISDVYKNLVDGTANADRQIFLSMAIDTNMYDISPKFCAFYACMLEKLVKMFDEEYAFFINPTLEYNTKTKVLFQRKRSVGKVVVIKLSEKTIEQIDVNQICIMHEAFHSLTRKERLRRKRAICFQQVMMAGIWQLMYQGVEFHKDTQIDEKIKDSIMAYFFADLGKEKERYENENIDDKFFYGDNIEAHIDNIIVKSLISIFQDNRRLQEIVLSNVVTESYKEFSDEVKIYDAGIQKLKENVLNITAKGIIGKISTLFLEIFRETYADLGCILTLELKPAFYRFAFEEVPQIQGIDYDQTCMLRKMIVADTISKTRNESFAAEWREYKEDLEESFNNTRAENNGIVKESNGQKEGAHVIIGYNRLMMNAFSDYLKECSELFSNRLAGISSIGKFREVVQKALNKDEALIADILLGKFELDEE